MRALPFLPARITSWTPFVGLALVIALAAPTAHSQVTCWEGVSGVLPSDNVVPEPYRFDVIGEVDDVTLVGDVMNVIDGANPDGVQVRLDGIPEIATDASWEMSLEIQMHHANRNGIPWGNASSVQDETTIYILGVDDDGVGFIEGPNDWVDDQFIPMDVTDRRHRFHVVASTTDIRLFIDDAAVPSLTLPKSSFPLRDGASYVSIVSTSIAGIAKFDPPVVAPGDPLLLCSDDGEPAAPLLVFLSSIDGLPFLTPILSGSYNAECRWTFPLTVPPGISGLELGFTVFGIQKGGGVEQSPEALVAFL